MKKIFLTFLFSLLPLIACAQVLVNPSTLQWDAVDHNITTRYEVGYVLAGAVDPAMTVFFDKTTANALDPDTFTANLPKPALGAFTVKMRACGVGADSAEVCSDWSDVSNGFKFTPKKPQTLGVR